MAIRQVFEGPWEEVSREAGQLSGKRVRLELLESPLEPPSGEASPFHATATPEARAEAFIAWGKSHAPRNAPPLSDEAISRESIYASEE